MILIEVTEYFAFNLLTNYASNTEIRGFVDKYDFYIFPVVNPDGVCCVDLRIIRILKNNKVLYTLKARIDCGEKIVKTHLQEALVMERI